MIDRLFLFLILSFNRRTESADFVNWQTKEQFFCIFIDKLHR